ncbi:hypothetical protein QX776_03790 [Alteromonadaceae bacterium BrNp21-10]|nr:hypothetical protein [Alteromonadaceae bacterium BrNp21-10]
MKTTLIALATFALSATTLAAPVSYNHATLDAPQPNTICIASAVLGLTATKNIVEQDFDEATLCNGMPITEFAEKFSNPAQFEIQEQITNVKFVAKDNSDASLLCEKAALEGLKALRLNSDAIGDVTCNGRDILNFAMDSSSKL